MWGTQRRKVWRYRAWITFWFGISVWPTRLSENCLSLRLNCETTAHCLAWLWPRRFCSILSVMLPLASWHLEHLSVIRSVVSLSKAPCWSAAATLSTVLTKIKSPEQAVAAELSSKGTNFGWVRSVCAHHATMGLRSAVAAWLEEGLGRIKKGVLVWSVPQTQLLRHTLKSGKGNWPDWRFAT